jgi:broad specificity phosphatase PhoE
MKAYDFFCLKFTQADEGSLFMSESVYLVRHATPDWSRVDIRYDIPPGPPLTSQGEAEATQLGAFLQTAGIRRIYASPLERARRTAELAAAIVNLEVVEALPIAEWQRGENEEAVLQRFLSFWEETLAESAKVGPIALVSHGGPIRLMLRHLELPTAEIDFYRKQFDRDNPLPPAGVWHVTRTHQQAPWSLSLAFTPQPFKRYESQPASV